MTQISKKALKDLAKALDTRIDHKTPTQATITLATVIKAVKGDYWVQLDGAATSTPAVSSTVAVSVGDRVQVRIQDGKLTITGNATQQATNVAETVSIVEPVADTAEAAKVIADTASNKATDAKKIAQATSQHFYHDDQGAHVTTDTSNANLLANSQGVAVRAGENPLTTMGTSGFTIYDGQGGEEANVLAKFSSDGVNIGRTDKTHVVVGVSDLSLYDKDNQIYFRVKDFRDDSGVATVEETLKCSELGTNSIVYTKFDIDSIIKVTSDGTELEAVKGDDGENEIIITGFYEFVIATYNTTETMNSFMYGSGGSNNGIFASSMGYQVDATGDYSQADNYITEASGFAAHAEGVNTVAKGLAAHAQNYSTAAMSDYQTAIGKYNIRDENDEYALIIGNGDEDTESNALTIDWDGNVAVMGSLDVYGITRNSNALKVLWSGGAYMNGSQTINLNESISDQGLGIVLHWQSYSSGTVQNYNHVYHFIPKTHVSSYAGSGVVLELPYSANSTTGAASTCTKYLYVSDQAITGHKRNAGSASANYVLTQVIGVNSCISGSGGGGGSYTAGIGLNLSGSEFSLKPSSNVNLGGVVVGANINIEDGGIISVANGTTDKAGVLQLGTQSTMAAQGNHTHADKVDVSDYTSRQNYIDKQFTGLGVDIDDCQDSITEITNKLTAIADSEIENL